MSKTHIVVILDRSGSMDDCKQATIDGFDEFINKQKQEKGKAILTLAQFDDQYEILHNKTKLKDVISIKDLYKPRGMTALFDAIGKTITSVDGKKSNKVLCVIITDGMENASKEYNRDKIIKLIREREKANWEFIFLGANMDAVAAATNIGIKSSSAATYDTNNTNNMFSVVSRKCAMYRSASNSGMKNIKTGNEEMFDESDRKELC